MNPMQDSAKMGASIGSRLGFRDRPFDAPELTSSPSNIGDEIGHLQAAIAELYSLVENLGYRLTPIRFPTLNKISTTVDKVSTEPTVQNYLTKLQDTRKVVVNVLKEVTAITDSLQL